jgi:acyl carrier protein
MKPEILPFISTHIGIPEFELTPDRKLTDLNLPSLDLIELVFALEEKFHVEIPFDANAKYETVGDLMEAIQCQKPC